MTVDAWWPKATRIDVPYWAEASPLARAPLGWVVHVVVGNGSPYRTFAQAPRGTRRFSHLWVSKAGHIEQYAPLTYKSWAQGGNGGEGGNGTYWSVETEGFPNEPFTDAQLDVLAEWHVYSGTLYRLADKPGDLGIACHYIGGADWGGHSCPDPAGMEGRGPRSLARTEILRRAQDIRTGGADMPITDADATKIADTVETRYQVRLADGSTVTRDDAIGRILRRLDAPVNITVDVNALAAAVVAKLPAGTTLDVAALAKAVCDEQARRLAT